MDIVNVIKALNGPAEKLIDAISKGIGTIYEPHKIRKIADAEAYRIEAVSKALSQNEYLPISYNKDGLDINTKDFEELSKRAASRFVYQEVTHQMNVERIADKAYDLLSNDSTTISENVSEEWITRFISSSQDTSDEEIQNLWAKLLAGEIKKPNTHSFRLLNVLKNMTIVEIQMLNKIMPYVVSNEFLPNDDDYLNKASISYAEILVLDECGIINSSALLKRNIKMSTKENVIAFCNNYILLGKNLFDNQEQIVKIKVFELTGVGKELVSVIKSDFKNDLFFEYSKNIKNSNENKDVCFTLHLMTNNDGKSFSYDDVDLFTDDNML